ncbi:YopX family protein [Streptococcus vestibularis]|jgi:hypothetical protein
MTPKFRAWDKRFSEFVEDFFVSEDGKIYKKSTDTGYGIAISRETSDKLILMQSTGLKDYFGEELFEGDVIEWSYWDGFEDSGTAKIIFDKGMFKLLDVRTEKSAWDNLFDCIENCSVFLQGNIYENPELLEAIKCTQK